MRKYFLCFFVLFFMATDVFSEDKSLTVHELAIFPAVSAAGKGKV